MNGFLAIVVVSLLLSLRQQMARSPVAPTFAADLGTLPEPSGLNVAASTTGVFLKLPSGALSDLLGRRRMMVLGKNPYSVWQERYRDLLAQRDAFPDAALHLKWRWVADANGHDVTPASSTDVVNLPADLIDRSGFRGLQVELFLAD